MRIVLDIGESAADVPAVLRAMDGDGLTLVGVDGSRVGCRITGVVYSEYPGAVDTEYLAKPLEEK